MERRKGWQSKRDEKVDKRERGKEGRARLWKGGERRWGRKARRERKLDGEGVKMERRGE